MSELQIGLLALGVLFVVLVFAYNKWQERRQRAVAERMLRGRGDLGDPFAAPREEPMLGASASSVRNAYAATDDDLVENIDIPPVGNEAPSVPGEATSAEPLPDLIDYVAVVAFPEPVAAACIAEAAQGDFARLSKPVRWLVRRHAEWVPFSGASDDACAELRVSMQLVDRRGAVSEGDVERFANATRRLAEDNLAVADFDDPLDALDRGVDLDRFCADVDIQIGLNIVSDGVAFQGTRIRALAESSGMTLNANGEFERCDESGRCLYTLCNQEAALFAADTLRNLSTHGVTLLLDVPRVPQAARVFDEMYERARQFADTLHGSVVDDNRRAILSSEAELIRAQIERFQARMTERGIAPGGALALRLFS